MKYIIGIIILGLVSCTSFSTYSWFNTKSQVTAKDKTITDQAKEITSLNAVIDTYKTTQITQATKLKESNDKLVQVSEDYLAQKAQLEEKQKIVYQTVEKIVDHPVYHNVCLDNNGLSALNSQVDAYTQ